MGLSGLFLAMLGIALALGLLLRRPWARWTGLLGAFWLAFVSGLVIVQGRGEALGIAGMLGSPLTLLLLLVPKTGRFVDAAPPGRGRVWTGRVLAFVAAAALLGLTAAAAIPSARGPAKGADAATAPARDAAPAEAKRRAETLEWHDFAPGLEQARRAGKPMLVDFYAVWCGPCKMMDRETFRDPEVIDRLAGIVTARVDAEEEKPRAGLTGYDLAEKYGVMTYPTIALLDGDGKVIARFSGYRSPRAFLGWLDSAMAKVPRPA
jgi:thiol:disulfide interchange protein